MNRKFLGIFIVIFIASCKKDKKVEIPESEINYEIDGVPYQLKSKTEISFKFVGNIQTTGNENPTNLLFIMVPNLVIKVKDFNNQTPIKQGTYSGKTFDSDGNEKGVEISYGKDSTNYESSYNNPDTEVKIKAINNKGVYGTFRGLVIFNFDTLRFENGMFDVKTYKN
jgi:hypothetical protein